MSPDRRVGMRPETLERLVAIEAAPDEWHLWPTKTSPGQLQRSLNAAGLRFQVRTREVDGLRRALVRYGQGHPPLTRQGTRTSKPKTPKPPRAVRIVEEHHRPPTKPKGAQIICSYCTDLTMPISGETKAQVLARHVSERPMCRAFFKAVTASLQGRRRAA